MRLAIESFSCFWKSLTSIFDPLGDLGQNGLPNLALWAPNLNYRSVPRNYVSFRRVISIEKPSWTPFPIWAWVCDQLYTLKFIWDWKIIIWFYHLICFATLLLFAIVCKVQCSCCLVLYCYSCSFGYVLLILTLFVNLVYHLIKKNWASVRKTLFLVTYTCSI